MGLAVSLAALAGTIVPSGAGQHFGIIGGDGGTFLTNTAFGPAGEPGNQVSASGFFVRGIEASATDQHVAIFSEIACISMSTSLGADHGCIRRTAIPPMPDPALGSDSLEVIFASDRHRGGTITVSLKWTATGEPEPDLSTDLFDGDTDVTVLAGLARRASVSGTIQSSTVGGGAVQMADGFLTRGTTVRGCSSDPGTTC